VAFANGHMLDNPAQFRAGASHAQRKLLFRNGGSRRFSDVTSRAGAGFALEKVGRGLVSGDIDNDGDLDLLVTNNGQTADLLRNDGAGGHALLVRLVGTQSNRDGIGVRLRLTAGGRTQLREVKAGSSYLGQNDVRQHFGLGDVTRAERLEVRWPSGRVDVVPDPPVDVILSVREGSGIVDRRAFAR
jgi:enediyne biosynthesis protein E4